jgi:hypothetical protein
MNDINHERGILRRKYDVINHLRSHRCAGQITIERA